jgi:AraC family transcriptional activator of pobA
MERATIPYYGLYGDDDVRPFEFVHVEPLRVRSEQYDWAIDVHAHRGLAQLVVLLGGSVGLTVDGWLSPMRAPAVATIPSGAVHALDVEPDSTGWVVMLDENELVTAQLGRWLRWGVLDRPAVLDLDASTADELAALCANVQRELASLEPAHDAMVRWQTLVLLTTLARRVRRDEEQAAPVDRFRDFRQLVEHHFTEHRPIPWYAEGLHLSESSLNRLCQAATGRTAFEIVQDRLEIEARRRLRYTSVPIGVLAVELGFDDQSYFARFFRRRTGSSPSAFQQSAQR